MDVEPIGSARRIDQLGRVVVPVELRRLLGLREGDLLDIRAEGGRLVLHKLEPSCALCGHDAGLRSVRDKFVCGECVGLLLRD